MIPGETHQDWVERVFVGYYLTFVSLLEKIAPKNCEDLAQYAFLKLLATPSFDRSRPGVHAWLMKVARNAHRTSLEKLSWQTELDATIEQESSLSEGPLRVLLAKELVAKVEEVLAIGALSRLQAEVIRLRFLGGLSHREIELLLGINKSKSVLCEALKVLRNIFRAESAWRSS